MTYFNIKFIRYGDLIIISICAYDVMNMLFGCLRWYIKVMVNDGCTWCSLDCLLDPSWSLNLSSKRSETFVYILSYRSTLSSECSRYSVYMRHFQIRSWAFLYLLFWFKAYIRLLYISCTYNVRSFDHLAVEDWVERHIQILRVFSERFFGVLFSSLILYNSKGGFSSWVDYSL